MPLYWTDRYEMFLDDDCNREIRNYDGIIASMKKHGFIETEAIGVRKVKGGMYEIRSGHHRFHCAKKLGIKLAYIVSDDDATLSELEKLSRPWSLQDWLTYHRKKKTSIDYEILNSFIEKYELPLSISVDLLHSGIGLGFEMSKVDAFRHGKLNIDDDRMAVRIGKIIKILKANGFEFVSKIGFIKTIKDLFLLEHFDESRLVESAIKNKTLFTNQPSVKNFMEMIERVYNFRRRAEDKEPLSLQVERAKKAAMAESAKRLHNGKANKKTKEPKIFNIKRLEKKDSDFYGARLHSL